MRSMELDTEMPPYIEFTISINISHILYLNEEGKWLWIFLPKTVFVDTLLFEYSYNFNNIIIPVNVK